jgi:hypothetical protein
MRLRFLSIFGERKTHNEDLVERALALAERLDKAAEELKEAVAWSQYYLDCAWQFYQKNCLNCRGF